MPDWRVVQDKVTSCIVQIIVKFGTVDLSKPYISPNDSTSSGSGFLIHKGGYIITNAHVVMRAINIIVRFTDTGRQPFQCEIVAVCPDKDLAMIKIKDLEQYDNVIRVHERLKKSGIKLGNDDELYKTQPIMAVGFPMGDEDINFATGVVSGFNKSDEDFKPVSYIQITAPINPGNSGGPLINEQGEVVGINAAGYLFSQNIGFAIPSRVLAGLLAPFFSNENNHESNPRRYVISTPVHGIGWTSTNKCMLDYMRVQDESVTGVLVSGVSKDGFTNGVVREDDIISKVFVPNVFDEKKSLSVEGHKKGYSIVKTNSFVCAQFDNFGQIVAYRCKFNNSDDPDFANVQLTDDMKIQDGRKMALSELLDFVPQQPFNDRENDAYNVTFELWRKDASDEFSKRIFVNCMYKHKVLDTPRITMNYWNWEKYNYEIFCGMCVGDITMNLIQLLSTCPANSSSCKNLIYYELDENQFDHRVVLLNTFGNTEIHKLQIINVGDIIYSIRIDEQEHIIQNIADMREFVLNSNLEKTDCSVIFKTKAGSKFALSLRKCVLEDLDVCSTYNIIPTPFIQELVKRLGISESVDQPIQSVSVEGCDRGKTTAPPKVDAGAPTKGKETPDTKKTVAPPAIVEDAPHDTNVAAAEVAPHHPRPSDAPDDVLHHFMNRLMGRYNDFECDGLMPPSHVDNNTPKESDDSPNSPDDDDSEDDLSNIDNTDSDEDTTKSQDTEQTNTPKEPDYSLTKQYMKTLTNRKIPNATDRMWTDMFIDAKQRSSELAKRRSDALRNMANVEDDVYTNDQHLIERGRKILDDDEFMTILSKLLESKTNPGSS